MPFAEDTIVVFVGKYFAGGWLIVAKYFSLPDMEQKKCQAS